jgi:hypothetical protein
MSILTGVDGIIDRHLRITDIGTRPPHYNNKTSCIRLSESRTKGFSSIDLVSEMLAQVESNWAVSPRNPYPGPSKENWRWEKKLDVASHNPSLETTLEKAAVRVLDNSWVNQIPTASGLIDSSGDKHRNIDLGHRTTVGRYELIELKLTSNNPLAAAVQLLCYAVLYLFARKHYPANLLHSKELLQAASINWVVLAPTAYYKPYRLGWLATALEEGLLYVANRHSIPINFRLRFSRFPSNFVWTGDEDNEDAIMPALQAVKPVW